MRPSAPIQPSHRALVDALKRRGGATVPELAGELSLSVETVREHLRTLESRALVARNGTRRRGPGRPEIRFMLTPDAEALFPRREGEVLRALAGFLATRGHQPLLRAFYEEYLAEVRASAMARVAHLEGGARLEEVARVFAELGFMPVLEMGGAAPQLRLCHCPVRALVDVTQVPCRAESGLLRELLGDEPARVSFMPEGDAACAYVMEATR